MRTLFPALLILLSLSAAAQNSIPPIDGWNQQVQGARYTFTPNSENNFLYEVMPPEQHVDELANWLDKTAKQTAGSAPSVCVLKPKRLVLWFDQNTPIFPGKAVTAQISSLIAPDAMVIGALHVE